MNVGERNKAKALEVVCGVMVACSILCGRYATACCGTRALQGQLLSPCVCVCVCVRAVCGFL